jgi:hypothetical protein
LTRSCHCAGFADRRKLGELPDEGFEKSFDVIARADVQASQRQRFLSSLRQGRAAASSASARSSRMCIGWEATHFLRRPRPNLRWKG